MIGRVYKKKKVSNLPFSRFLASCSGVRLATPLLPGPIFFLFLAASSATPRPPGSDDAPLLLLTADSPPGLAATSSEPLAMFARAQVPTGAPLPRSLVGRAFSGVVAVSQPAAHHHGGACNREVCRRVQKVRCQVCKGPRA